MHHCKYISLITIQLAQSRVRTVRSESVDLNSPISSVLCYTRADHYLSGCGLPVAFEGRTRLYFDNIDLLWWKEFKKQSSH